VNPLSIKPNQVRATLNKGRLQTQRDLLSGEIERTTLIQVTANGVVWDGHHGLRAAAEATKVVKVKVVKGAEINPPGNHNSILDIPIE
jgi:RNA-binding protein YhbY